MTTGDEQGRTDTARQRGVTRQPGWRRPLVPIFMCWRNAFGGRNWDIPNVVLGDSLIQRTSTVLSSRARHSAAISLAPGPRYPLARLNRPRRGLGGHADHLRSGKHRNQRDQEQRIERHVPARADARTMS